MECWCKGRFYLEEIALVTKCMTMSRGPGEVLRCPADPSVAHQDESCWNQPPRKGAATEGGQGTTVHSSAAESLGHLPPRLGAGDVGGVYRHRFQL